MKVEFCGGTYVEEGEMYEGNPHMKASRMWMRLRTRVEAWSMEEK